MAGSVKKDAKTGNWFYVLELGKNDTGKRIQKKKRGFKTKKEAQEALTGAQHEVNNGTFIEPSTTILKDYWEEWFKFKKSTIGIQTQKVYREFMNKHLIPSLGHIPLAKLKTIHIQSYFSELVDKGYASETIKKIYNIIRNSLEHACDLELISTNCAQKVKLPSNKRKMQMTVWNEDEVKRFLNATKNDRYFILFHLALLTGMRQGEILGLRWKDVDFQKSLLYITQTLSRDGRQIIEGAKTKSSIRSIPLPEVTLKLLKKHKAIISKEKLEQGVSYSNLDLVICTQFGTPLIPSNVRRTFIRLIKEADVPRIRFHDLRHTHATTLLLSKGINIKVISERLGHSNIRVTLDTYSHVLPTMQQEALKKLNEILV